MVWRYSPGGLLGLLALLVLGACAGSAAGQSPIPSAPSPDAVLWGRIEALAIPLAATTPYELRFGAERKRRRELLDSVQLYLRLYPGGGRRDDAVRVELETLFEIHAADGGALSALRDKAAAYLRGPPSEAVREEAAYWELQCRRLERRTAESLPAAEAWPTAADPVWLRDCRQFVETHPKSRHAPRLSEMLFEAAARERDVDAQQRIVDALRRTLPEHTTTQTLAGRLWRARSIGQPFSLEFVTVEGEKVDTASWRGAWVLVVFWSSDEPASIVELGAVEAFAAGRGGVRVVGIRTDPAIAAGEGAQAGVRRASPQWLLLPDRSVRVRRQWGIDRLPCAMVIDREGRLAAVAEGDGWRAVVERESEVSGER